MFNLNLITPCYVIFHLFNTWVLELEDIEKYSSRLLDKVRFSDRKSKSTKNLFKKGDVLYGKLRPYLDKVIIANEDGVCTTEIIPLQPSEFLDNRFLFYNLKRQEFLDYVADASHGVNMPRLGTKQGKEAPFVLAPLSEQIRIADKLDRILARVNAAQARLDKIPTLIKRFRQSVLAAATSGELTREWRENNVSAPMVDYDQVPFDDLLTELRNGLSPKPNENGKGIPILRISSVRSGAVDQSDIRYLEVEEKIRDLYKLKEGDLLFTRYNGSLEFVGGCGLLKELNHEYLLYPDKLIRARLCDKALPEYINIYFSSPKARNSMLESVKTTSGQKGISGKDIKSQLVGIPLLDEQYEIVRRVESLFSLADTVEKQYQDAKARTDRLTQVILAKAFRGELVPQNPDDEPAEALLQRIQQQRSEQATAGKRGKARKVSG